MHVKWSSLFIAMLALGALCAPVAHADIVTLGSTLAAPATVTQSNQADSAFWPASINGADPAVPADGQVLSVRVKGMAIQPSGAPKPLNEIHFQTLDGNTVYLSSAPFDLPYTGDPNQISEYKPENLCVHKGGIVAFNDEGGWDGTGTGPYRTGVPFRVFADAPASLTNQFSKDNGTKNGMLLAPPNLLRGTELLLQYTLATGDDRSYECGGPLRDPNGNVIKNMQVTPKQDAYVSSDGSFTIFGYCGDARQDCTGGVATVTAFGQTIATVPFSSVKQKSIKVPMKMSTADFAKLAALPGSKWTATVTMVTPNQGTVVGDIAMHASGGAMHIVKNQRVYVRGNRRASPAGFCGVPTGCAGTAALAVKGKVVATAKFVSKGSGKITINLRLPASIYKQLKKKPVLGSLAITGPLGSDAQPVLLRH
jgi:hypothetical protein